MLALQMLDKMGRKARRSNGISKRDMEKVVDLYVI